MEDTYDTRGGLTYVTASNPSAGFTPTGIYQQDRMYTAGYINGYRVGKSPSKWDDFWTGALFLLSQAGASGTPGGERTDPVMTMYNAGVMSGYLDGLRNQK